MSFAFKFEAPETDSSASSDNEEEENCNFQTNETFEDLLDRGVPAQELPFWEGNKNSPYYVYLMRSLRPPGMYKSPYNTHLGKGRNPVRKNIQHNLGLLDSKSTRQGRPNWETVWFVGPFDTKAKAIEFRDDWRKRRKLHRREEFLHGGHFNAFLTETQRKRVRLRFASTLSSGTA